MAVKILEGTGQGESLGAVLYCSTSEWAFGPVFDSAKEAMDFLEFCPQPRLMSDRELLDAVGEFRSSRTREGKTAPSVASTQCA
jgi:hypothetical protein